ncbi:MAG: hypothetical protein BGO98_13695 [Myxococcales bacterium 68-20]|nr:MAG: hypothetical protein BGO98_13695 [Myxococcales bacterium 68-20]
MSELEKTPVGGRRGSADGGMRDETPVDAGRGSAAGGPRYEAPVSFGRSSVDGGSYEEQQARARAVREALIGKSIAGRYILRALVGHGGMGAVYEAEHLGLGKRVAIKFIDQEFATDERIVARFAREARAMSAIESAHIVTVLDAGSEDGRPFLVMELLRGEDLGQRLRRTTRVPIPEAMHIVAQVLKGLAKAHAAGIVHRDLKPDNVFLTKSDTDPLFAKIVDFGVSKIERPRDKTSPLALTGRGTVLGTPFYMCPEQAQAMPDVDARADIYSVGAILFECLSGRPPHTGETYEQVILSICMREAPDLRAVEPSISPEIASFVARALSRDRAERFPSAERMLGALHELAPAEKTRVPLDVGMPETLMSPGVAPSPEKRPAQQPVLGTETRIAGSASGASDQESASASASRSASARSPGEQLAGAAQRVSSGASASLSNGTAAPLSRRKRSVTAIVVTAVLATLTGIGVMLAVITMLDRRSDTRPTPSSRVTSPSTKTTPPTITSGVPSPTPSEAVPSSSASSGSSASLDPPAVLEAPSSSSSAPPSTNAAPSKANQRNGGGGSGNGGSGSGSGSGGSSGASGAKPLDIARDLP